MYFKLYFSLCVCADIMSLILLTGSPDTTGTAVIESLEFLSKLLALSQKGEETRHLVGLIAQVNTMGHVDRREV